MSSLQADGRVQPPRERLHWKDLALLMAFLLWCGSEFLDYQSASERRDYEISAEQRGYVSRAAICDLQQGLGLNTSPGCADEGVVAYRDPTPSKGTQGGRESVKTRELMCMIVRSFDIHAPADYCGP